MSSKELKIQGIKVNDKNYYESEEIQNLIFEMAELYLKGYRLNNTAELPDEQKLFLDFYLFKRIKG